MKKDATFFDSNPFGGILTLLSEDTQMVQNAFGIMKSSQFSNLGQSLLGLILCYIYSWKIALIATCYVPFTYFSINFFTKLIDKHVSTKFEFLANTMTIAEETISNVRTVKSYNKEKGELSRFMKEVKNTQREDRKIGCFIFLLQTLLLLVLWGIVLGQLYWCGTLVFEKKMEGGELLSVFGFLMLSGFGVIEFLHSIQSEQKAISSGLRILDLISQAPSIQFDDIEHFDGSLQQITSKPKIVNDFKGKIEFKNVSFKYPTRNVYILKNVSFIIHPGKISAFVGHSGCGKSTCVQLIERYYDVEEGQIEIDGINIKELDQHWLHQNIGLVSQEPSLFETTIRENIKYGNHKAMNSEIEKAAEMANAKNFINKLTNKYEYNVGEKGNGLSGGQKQRIAIARALVKNPIILITDEATSALDSKSEKKVTDALNNVMESRTAIIVAHRLNTIQKAQEIFVFDDGELKEVGNHQELILKQGYYFDLMQQQMKKNNENAKDLYALHENDYENDRNDDNRENDRNDDNSENDDDNNRENDDDDNSENEDDDNRENANDNSEKDDSENADDNSEKDDCENDDDNRENDDDNSENDNSENDDCENDDDNSENDDYENDDNENDDSEI